MLPFCRSDVSEPLLRLWLLLTSTLGGWTVAFADQSAAGPVRPNILWITSEDNGQQLGCYGDSYADTPNLDALAAQGMKYQQVWSNAPVCAPARTAILMGIYPTSLGAQHMRSEVKLPVKVKPFPQLLRELGYYCTNNSKTDYNVQVDLKEIWNESSPRAHWRNRPAGQPFFSVFNLTISHESQIRTRPHQPVHEPAGATVPSYHPDTAEVRQDWAQYYDRLTEMDQQVGAILQQLQADGLKENTIVFYFGDHGSGMPRSKRWLYESGLRVPLIVHIPDSIRPQVFGDYAPGTTSQRLIGFVDLAPTLLSILGVPSPDYHQGNPFLGKYASQPVQYLYAFRDRMDERYDMSRAVRDARFSYIRNFMPYRPQGAYLEYMFETPTTRVWKSMFDQGQLNAVQSRFWQFKPSEELYDLDSDPEQIHNLADDPTQQATLGRMRNALHEWMLLVKDLGLLPEGEMLRRSGEQSPYDWARRTQQFPIQKILDAAVMSSAVESVNVEDLEKNIGTDDSACRYWLASGLLGRAESGQQREHAILSSTGLMGDQSPYVRCLASEVLARFGTPSDRQIGVAALLDMVDLRNEGYFPSLQALNSLDWSKPTAEQLGGRLDLIPKPHDRLSERYKSYIPRMVRRISQPE